MGLRIGLTAIIVVLPSSVLAAKPSGPAKTDEIVVTAPGGARTDATALDAVEISRTGTPDALAALARDAPGLSLSDAQGNALQPNLVYHGFTISPLQGSEQGLAVYLDGARFNQPFGDTVQFDLLPQTAIASLSLRETSAVYGLNALGGALAVTTKTGRTAPGVTLALSGGEGPRVQLDAEAGGARGAWSGYMALRVLRDDGWRDYSPSRAYSGFADIGYDGVRAGLHFKLIAADTDLTGNGAAPLALIDADPRSVFTHPDATRNRFVRLSAHPWIALGGHTRVEASPYWQELRQYTLNADASDIASCSDPEQAGRICFDGGDGAVVTTTGDAPIADALPGGTYGVVNVSATRTIASGALVQLIDDRTLLSGQNQLTYGFSYDGSKTRFASGTSLGALTPTRGVIAAGPPIYAPDGGITPVGLMALTRYWGVFFTERLPLLPRFAAELALRQNDATVRLRDQIGTALSGSHHFARLDPGIELGYTLPGRLELRAGYAEANRAPTPAELSCADPAAPCSLANFFIGDPALKQVVGRTLDLGATATGTGAWHPKLTVSAYRETNSDDIQRVASLARARGYFANVGRTRRQGVDATLEAARGPWRARLGYAWTEASFRTALTLVSPDNPAADANGKIAVRAGNRLPGVPEHRGTASIDYTGGRFSAGADLQAQSGLVYFGDEANAGPTTRPFAVVNLRASAATGGNTRLFAEVTNLLATNYATYGLLSDVGTVSLTSAQGAGDPRFVGPGASRRWRFGLRAIF